VPRKKTDINPKLLEKLKQLLLDESSIVVKRSVDCDKLAEIVSRKTNTYINGISFKRLFGFTKYPFNPSIQTLDILCQFVGFEGWYQFEQYQFGRKSISKQEIDIYGSCFDIDLVNDVAPHEGAFQSVSRKIALRFREDPSALLRNLPGLMKKKQFQVFFAEHFPDYDNLCSYYYQVYKSYLKHKTTLEGQLFGNCMLFLRSFWNRDEANCTKYLIAVNSITINNEIHPYVIGRYYACNFLFDSFFNNGDQFDKYYDEYIAMGDLLPKNGKHFYDFPASEYIVSEALLHCKQYEKCIEVIDKATHDYSLRMKFVRKGYYRQMQLIWLIAFKKLNLNQNIDSQLEKIQPENFYFISQKYFSVLYHYSKGTPQDMEKAKDLAIEIKNQYFIDVFLNKC
jgi:hypothetical protein